MLTQCPQCHAIYRIVAAQLSAAHGFVTCGECQAVFNALGRLADEPVIAVAQAAQVDVAELAPPDASPPSPEVAAGASPSIDLNEVPAVLREDVARLLRRERRGAVLLWGIVCLCAFLGLGAQVAWHWRTHVFARYPALEPIVERWCVKLGCSIPALPGGAQAIALAARDVREHPQYAHTWLVNATLENRGDRTVAYPVIQLGIYDHTGSIVGIRRFQPRDYLDQSIDIERGLASGRAVYIVLEIAGASDAADSFEFTFL